MWSLITVKLVTALKFLLLGLLKEVILESLEIMQNWNDEQRYLVCLSFTNKLPFAMENVLNAATLDKCDRIFHT